MRLDVDHPPGRAAQSGRQWPGGVMVCAIHPTLGMLIASLKNVFHVDGAPFSHKSCGNV